MIIEQKDNDSESIRHYKPYLSVLIPSIPERKEKAFELYERVVKMAEGKDVEVLMLIDNKKRTIGEKRDALKDIANGVYFMFVDDDDDLVSLKSVYEIASTKEVDVITFKSKCKNSDGSTFIVTSGLGNEVEHNVNESGMYVDCKRPPFHICAWHERFKIFDFPAEQFGEDWGFVKQAIGAARTEHHIDEVVHLYNFDPKISTVSKPIQVGLFNLPKPVVFQVVESNEDAGPVAYFQIKGEQRSKMAVVNLITDTVQRYVTAQERMIKSFVEHVPPGTVDCYFFRNESTVGSPTHSDNPYAFKLYAIEQMKKIGYEMVLWLDASVVATRDIMPIFDRIKREGVFFEHSGHMAGQWTNEEALQILGVTREEAFKMPMFSAGFTGIDFTNPIGDYFFTRWADAMKKGAFMGSHIDHRHDMSAGSIIANQMGLVWKYANTTDYFSYIGPGYTPNPESIFQLLGF